MTKQIIISRGIFSTLTISLNSDVADKLAMIPTEENPLASVKEELDTIISKFERAYFEAAQPSPVETKETT